ncbi:PDDEXK family nuclease [Acidaminobacter hydrogenoformans]|uniref:hypothetical protein n=1 Tax=Acidaminobacter hydrogenoformans TaxID=65403 RepID=UPI0011139C3F|nr:hypothetical protein [Acidaminobacter hydrogenoformans]
MIQFRPLDTLYNGYRFRSRLEARWAVFFDEVGLAYEYEPQGYELPPIVSKDPPNQYDSETLWYLPDFYLPELDLIVEVKGPELPPEDAEKVKRMSFYSNSRVALLRQIPNPEKLISDDYFKILYNYDYAGECDSDHPYWFCVCEKCGKIGYEFEGLSERIKCECPEKWINFNDKRLLKAYARARQARFEHGERP